jgi:hypothetical protein
MAPMAYKATAKLVAAVWLALGMLLSTGGCIKVNTKDLRQYHHDVIERGTSGVMNPDCPDLVTYIQPVDIKHGGTFAVEPGCYGFHPTCWRPWPGDCPPCPPYAAMETMPPGVMA